MMDLFEPFPKIPRLYRDVVITEKLDGTNAQVFILTPDSSAEDWEVADIHSSRIIADFDRDDGPVVVMAGSRKRFIIPGDDNFGFAQWVYEHVEELVELGHGRHFGEWWGGGIQRGYGTQNRYFSLFNTTRWVEEGRPACCNLVPVLYEGPFSQDAVNEAVGTLMGKGSLASPGFDKPEGIVIYHKHSNGLFKWTFDGDGHKG